MASMRASRMHDDGIGRYPTISASPCVRTCRTRRPSPRPERPTRMPSRRERRHSARLPPRPDAERYVHTVHDPMVPIGGIAVGIGGSLRARNDPKGRFSPREAPSAAAVRFSPEVEIAIRCRAAPSRPSRTPCEVGPTTARHWRCPLLPAFSPAGQGVKTCKSVP